MLQFSKIENIEDIKKIKSYIQNSDNPFSCYNLYSFFMWGDSYPREYAIWDNTLMIREQNAYQQPGFFVFYPTGDNTYGAIDRLIEYCSGLGQSLILTCLTPEMFKDLSGRYICGPLEFDRTWSDYVYLSSDMQTFSGKKFSGQRNHINRFIKSFGSPQYSDITKDNKDQVREFLHTYGENRNFTSRIEYEEFQKDFLLLEEMETLDAIGGTISVNGKIIAISIGAIRNDTLYIAVEKALRSYPGAYQVMVQAFAQRHTDQNIKYINREDDMGLEGLRISKTQYHPIEIKHKYFTLVKGVKTDEQ